jgi:hypothetical protein
MSRWWLSKLMSFRVCAWGGAADNNEFWYEYRLVESLLGLGEL